MNYFLRAGCLAIYLGALVSLSVALPHDYAVTLQVLAGLLLVVHLLEVFIFMRHLRLYQGPVAISIVLTLLFGLLHWQPLLAASKRN